MERYRKEKIREKDMKGEEMEREKKGRKNDRKL